jgi:hypothetical protein
MIENEEAQKNGWVRSEIKPGYLTKALKYNTCTVTINRPILTPEEQKKREAQVTKEAEYALSNYVFRKKNLDASE